MCRNNTLESAALVNEAYLKLIRARGVHCENRTHFFALCAQMIRRILVDHAAIVGMPNEAVMRYRFPWKRRFWGQECEGWKC